MATNQGWREERSSTRSRGVHQIESTDMLAAKMDLLLKKLNDTPEAAPVHALDSHMTCEVCGNIGHSGNSCPETQPEDANFIGNSTNGFNGNRPQPGWNSRPSLPFSGQGNSSNSQQFSKGNYSFDQKGVNDSISKKFHANDRLFESISLQMETLNSAMKNQLSFNKMLETQIAQLAAALPNANPGKLPGQPEAPPKEHINAVTTRGGKSTQDPPSPSHAGKAQEKIAESEDKVGDEDTPGKEEKPASKHLPHEFYDTTVLLFPLRNKKAAADEQYSKFVEVIKKLYVNIPLLDAMQVPTYAKYLKDILNNKKPLPSTEIVHLTEECSAAILKKKDPRSPTISCSIGTQHFDHALCDLGASVSVMPKVIFDKLNHDALAPTAMCLQLADQSVRYPEGVAENVAVRIRNLPIPVDFVVLDMEIDSKTPLILGRPFLSTADATIDVGAGKVHLNINGKKETFAFKPKVEQCNKVKTFKCQAKKDKPKANAGTNPSNSKEDSLVTFMLKKLKIEAEIQQKEYERAMQRRRLRSQETRCGVKSIMLRDVNSTAPCGLVADDRKGLLPWGGAGEDARVGEAHRQVAGQRRWRPWLLLGRTTPDSPRGAQRDREAGTSPRGRGCYCLRFGKNREVEGSLQVEDAAMERVLTKGKRRPVVGARAGTSGLALSAEYLVGEYSWLTLSQAE
ncbi:hypothetical protein U9M48_000138 [Paspalum notatum var. saurae]|uniref:CCHC-type domain-containing protein n=1 Tax=Paspalum notatum var. saurae TaxID=547442 RepID=A0AAQ3PEH6_PASNO